MSQWISRDTWGSTPLGAPEDWPPALRTLVDLILASSQPMFVTWGSDRRLLYNRQYAEILGYRHPSALGRPFLEVWGELSSELSGSLERGYAGEPSTMDFRRVRRQEDDAEVQLRFSCTPLRGADGRVEGLFCIGQEITDPVLAKRALQEGERRLHLASEAAHGGIFESSLPLGASSEFSVEWAEILGYEASDLPVPEKLREWLIARIHADDRESFERAYCDFAEGHDEGCEIEVRFKHRQGHWIWVCGVFRAVERNPDNSVRRFVGMMFDTTESKRTEQALLESEARFREMADGLPLIIWVHDAAGQQELVNRTFCEFFGVTREQMKGGRWQMLMHPDDAEQYSREFMECVRERRAFHGETRVKRGDGQWRWLESWGRPRFTREGDFWGFVGTSADVTDRKEAEAARRQSEQRFRMLADNMDQLAWMADEEGSVSWYNKRWFDYTGTTLEQVRGRGWTQLQHPDHVLRVTYRLERCIETGEPWEDVFPLRGKDGSYRWFLARARPIRDAWGRVSSWFGTKTDVTAQREAEEQLRASDRQKDEFLAMLGHELRNPLAAIQSASELMKLRRADDPLLERTQGVLERQAAHMARLIDGLLEVSRIARGKILLEREALDLRKVVEDVLQDRSGEMAQRQLDSDKDFPEEALCVLGDQVRLAQVFDHLIGNAIKFTEPGGSIMVIGQREQAEVVVCVQDTGVGIREEILSRIFEPFQQEEQGIARSAGGLGLGLALVKGLVELHGGRIDARSAGPGTGAVFEVRFPLTAEVARVGRAGQKDAPPARSVLIVEDNVDAASLLRELLEIQGHQARVANDGYRALEALREEPADIVLCDLGLPGMSGYELARQIRQDTSLRPIRIVALTGYGQPSDRRRTLESGFDAHLTKPVDLAAIEEVLG